MADYIPSFISFFGGLVSGWVAHTLVIRREARSRTQRAKDEFAAVASTFKGRIPETGIEAFFNASLDPIRDAVFRLQPFLDAPAAAHCLQAWNAYKATDPEQLHDENELEIYRLALAADGRPVPPKPTAILHARLETLERAAK